ncbi:hypothetical protein [Methylobacterium sp. Leaf108]|uniref:hypothetical protein n=1 Tax=Methylobacterium sp. Leaf108 TaxID=1736256 RepID=UPI0006F9213D|nr:hypothetical protein [Methylobacterium sp. Leaf108]KQP61441.1 hypothetical protein ASF39_01785 [Methylobacterium sp. Leaf108]
MGVVVEIDPAAGRAQGPAPMTAEGHAARMLADVEIARARLELDAVAGKPSDPLALEIHAIRRALARLDITLHTGLGPRR